MEYYSASEEMDCQVCSDLAVVKWLEHCALLLYTLPYGAGEMVRAPSALADNSSLASSMHTCSQQPVIPAPGDLMPTSDLDKDCTYIRKPHTHTHNYKILRKISTVMTATGAPYLRKFKISLKKTFIVRYPSRPQSGLLWELCQVHFWQNQTQNL